MADIPAEADHLLEGPHFAHIATLKEDGSPQVSQSRSGTLRADLLG